MRLQAFAWYAYSAICTNACLHVRIDISRLHAIPCRDEEFDLRRFAGLLLPVRFRIASRLEGSLYLKQSCCTRVGSRESYVNVAFRHTHILTNLPSRLHALPSRLCSSVPSLTSAGCRAGATKLPLRLGMFGVLRWNNPGPQGSTSQTLGICLAKASPCNLPTNPYLYGIRSRGQSALDRDHLWGSSQTGASTAITPCIYPRS